MNDSHTELERAIWDRLSQEGGLDSHETSADSPELAANIETIHSVLRGLDPLQEPAEMGSATEARLQRALNRNDEMGESRRPTVSPDSLETNRRVAKLRPSWTLSGWALAATALMVVAAASFLVSRSGSGVDSGHAVGALGGRADIGTVMPLAILQTSRGVVVELEPDVRVVDGAELVVLHVTGLIEDQVLTVRGSRAEKMNAVALSDSGQGALTLVRSSRGFSVRTQAKAVESSEFEIRLALGSALEHIEVSVDGEAVAGRAVSAEPGAPLRWQAASESGGV